jgi:CheY-like chemotaxis protein
MKPVLVVDDEPQMRSLLKAVLAKDGLDSIEASDGCNAFETAKNLDGEISLLLTDINMPCGLDGLDLAHAIRSAFPEIPILVVSSAPATDRDRMDHGYAFLKKPFDLKLLAQTVHQLLTQRPESVRPR